MSMFQPQCIVPPSMAPHERPFTIGSPWGLSLGFLENDDQSLEPKTIPLDDLSDLSDFISQQNVHTIVIQKVFYGVNILKATTPCPTIMPPWPVFIFHPTLCDGSSFRVKRDIFLEVSLLM